MKKKILNEDAFDGAPGGQNGAINYGNTLGTFSSPDVSQNPSSFTSNNRNKALGQSGNVQDVTNRDDLNKDVNDIFSKGEKPSVDDVISGLDYEMGRMVKKDKAKGKEIVLTNLKKDPHYYRNLNQLNSSEDAITQNIHENSFFKIRDGVNIEETKKIFEDMFKSKKTKHDFDPRVMDAINSTIEDKKLKKMNYLS